MPIRKCVSCGKRIESPHVFCQVCDNDPKVQDSIPRVPTMGVKFPNVHVRLVGENGNAFAILGRVMGAMRRAKCTPEEIEAYEAEATSGDYDNLLRVTMRTVDCD